MAIQYFNLLAWLSDQQHCPYSNKLGASQPAHAAHVNTHRSLVLTFFYNTHTHSGSREYSCCDLWSDGWFSDNHPSHVGGASLPFKMGREDRCNRWRHILPGRMDLGADHPVRWPHCCRVVMHEHWRRRAWNIWPVGAANCKGKRHPFSPHRLLMLANGC
jgi:hypothetical protein